MLHAAHIVLVEEVDGSMKEVMNEYITWPRSKTDLLTFFSHITADHMRRGKQHAEVISQFLQYVEGNIVVTLAGEGDFQTMHLLERKGQLHKH